MVLGILAAQSAFAGDPDSEQGIVEEAWALERDPVLRPTHVDPAVPGTFEEGLAPWGAALTASAEGFTGSRSGDARTPWPGREISRGGC